MSSRHLALLLAGALVLFASPVFATTHVYLPGVACWSNHPSIAISAQFGSYNVRQPVPGVSFESTLPVFCPLNLVDPGSFASASIRYYDRGITQRVRCSLFVMASSGQGGFVATRVSPGRIDNGSFQFDNQPLTAGKFADVYCNLPDMDPNGSVSHITSVDVASGPIP
jgi:hypothetical protein